MNIGLIRMRYTPYGGAEVFLSRFVDELLKRGHICHIFASKWDEVKREESGITVGAGLPRPYFHRVKTFGPSFLRILSFAINSCFAVKKTNLDIVISFERTLCQDIYRAGDGCHREWLIQRLRSRGKGQGARLKKLVAYINPLHQTILFLEKRLFQSKRLKFVVTNSMRGKGEIMRHYGLPEKKICVIYNGIDFKPFDLNDRNESRAAYREKLNLKNEIMLLFVGSGFERKGLKFLIQALGILKTVGAIHELPLLKLIVVGKGNIKKYQDMADECSVGEDVRFAGPVKDVKGYYFAADIFCLPSIYEPFSNACLEAMASNLPVVTSRINGVSEILTHERDGMIVEDPSNPEEIAEKIKPLLKEEIRLAAGDAARKTAANYTIEKNVSAFLNLVERYK